MLDEKLLSHWEPERKNVDKKQGAVLFCNRLIRWMARGESDEITAIPTVTKESSHGDFSGSGIC